MHRGIGWAGLDSHGKVGECILARIAWLREDGVYKVRVFSPNVPAVGTDQQSPLFFQKDRGVESGPGESVKREGPRS